MSTESPAPSTRTSATSLSYQIRASSQEVISPWGSKPRARYGQTITLTKKNRLLMIAGTIYHEYFDDVWELSRETNTWTCCATHGKRPSPRFGHTAVMLPDGVKVMIFGGSNNTVWSSDTFLLDTETYIWTEITGTSRPSERRGHSMVLLGESVYMYGGQSANSQKDVWMFDSRTLKWEEIVPSSGSTTTPEARYCHSAVVYNDAMVVWGGHGSWGCVPPNLYAFCGTKKEWSKLETAGTSPGARFGHTAVCFGHRMVIFGGMDVYPTGTSFNDMYQLDFMTHVWSAIILEGSIPRGRRLHSVADCGAFLIVFGGWNGSDLFDDTFQIYLEPLTLKELMRQFILTRRIPFDHSSVQ